MPLQAPAHGQPERSFVGRCVRLVERFHIEPCVGATAAARRDDRWSGSTRSFLIGLSVIFPSLRCLES
eukprot:12085622-Ditylum_brightwellii.AAC.1